MTAARGRITHAEIIYWRMPFEPSRSFLNYLDTKQMHPRRDMLCRCLATLIFIFIRRGGEGYAGNGGASGPERPRLHT